MSEWGPWIEHDGKGCPCKGFTVESVDGEGEALIHVAGQFLEEGIGDVVDCWNIYECVAMEVEGWAIRKYRIRKPSGMTLLEKIVEKPSQELAEA